MSQYLKFWGIARPVFRDVEPGAELFVPRGLKTTLERLLVFASQDDAALAVMAPAGHGKTTLARWLYSKLPPATHDVVIVSLVMTETKPGWLASRLARFLGTGPQLSDVARGLDEIKREGRRLTLIIDEADKLASPESFEELHALIGMQSAIGSCLNIVMIGTAELEASLARSEAMARRVALRVRIAPLSDEDASSYVLHRLAQADVPATVLSTEALAVIAEHGQGIYSVINALAENCFVEAFLRGERRIDRELALAAVALLKGEARVAEPQTAERGAKSSTAEAIDARSAKRSLEHAFDRGDSSTRSASTQTEEPESAPEPARELGPLDPDSLFGHHSMPFTDTPQDVAPPAAEALPTLEPAALTAKDDERMISEAKRAKTKSTQKTDGSPAAGESSRQAPSETKPKGSEPGRGDAKPRKASEASTVVKISSLFLGKKAN